MINKLSIIIVFFGFLINPLYAGVDREFGGKTFWWTSHYSQFLSHLGIKKSYALVVGVGGYNDNTFAQLPSEQDAVRIKDFLITKGGFDHVRLLTGDKVTRERIHELMNGFYMHNLTNNDRFLFYWSGHGVTAGQSTRKSGYLALKTSSTNPASMLSMYNIRNWDNQLRARQTLYILDACFSGIAAAQAMSPTQEQTIDRVSGPSRQVLTAGLENQQTIAINDLQGGVFTRALLDGLEGRADTNKGNFKKDGVVTARELEAYIRQRVDHERRRVGWQSPITPVLYNFKNYAGDFFFVSNKTKLSKNKLILNHNVPMNGVIATGINIHTHKKQEAIFQQALEAIKIKNYSFAFQLLENLSNQGNLKARFQLGEMYLEGYGVAKSKTKGIDLWRKALTQIAQQAKSLSKPSMMHRRTYDCLMKSSSTNNKERAMWFAAWSYMTEGHKKGLADIYLTERKALNKIEKKYGGRVFLYESCW